MTSAAWMDMAACRPDQAAMFFPGSTDEEPRTPAEVEALKKQAFKICASCPVKNDCYQAALRNHETAGIWGGVYFGQRKLRHPVGRHTRRRTA